MVSNNAMACRNHGLQSNQHEQRTMNSKPTQEKKSIIKKIHQQMKPNNNQSYIPEEK